MHLNYEPNSSKPNQNEWQNIINEKKINIKKKKHSVIITFRLFSCEINIAQSAGAIEYNDFISAHG